ncbi:hypothetical protein [Sphingomonas jatrophae]|uniref:Beta/Gamma crystallin n=1 Tax=Sphingomonas jatrophae TaxID=1166337 RepID=A0A1I6K0J7_9SPHN|nr:hypothetical protein [Sphingomonas jatrophae]SFR84772.1 hypothetical protein SAMN05192580_1176 [Sphingomonas jatrophae]
MIENRFKRPLAAVALLIALAGCSGERKAAEQAVRDVLKDPESAQFEEFYYNKELRRACLTFNAKNEMGGYGGKSQAYLIRQDGVWHWNGEHEESPEECRRTWADDKSFPTRKVD